ncbi:Severe Depolymerization of Actin [Neophaeococcomyces mojaviensis]|uniref:Severe Depolymerization of Actin n=1 Tax=Neophaeococcomyces mojaviensis TaxID=3383035 RepID=A0ACC3A3U3_9EURO|nr:Severe Depolymerization of Actin [Knufia sp. JES_112]
MPKRKLAALEKVDADLTNLQHKIKRDPASYRSEFQQQWLQYQNQREIFMANPASTSESGNTSFKELLELIAQVSSCYKAETKEFPQHLIDILSSHHESLNPELREKIVGSLVLLRKKEIIDSNTLLQCLFPILTATSSKTLRALLLQKILSDLRNSNSKNTNHKLNRSVQTILHNLVLADRSSPKALWAVKITREMWKRQIWTDAKAVEIMKECALADNEKVAVGGVRFFLGGDKEREEHEEEDDSDDAEIDMAKLRHQVGINKKSKKADRTLKKAAATVKRKEKKKGQPHQLNFSALHLLHNAQGFAEELFQKHLQATRTKLNLEQKLLVLQLVSRLIGLHKLIIVPFYSYFLKFLKPKQPSVTTFLACLAQGTHNQVPPDELEKPVQMIANEFVSEAAAGEVAASGLNAIREICVRQPLAIDETLLQDLVMYRKSKDKGVMMAAKGLLGLYRQVDPEMLKSRDRGRDAALGLKAGDLKQKRYGEEATGEIEGLDLLEKWKEEERQRKRIEKGLPADGSDIENESEDDELAWDAWNVEDDASDDSGGWINVESDEEINISDSDDDQPPKPQASKKVKFDLGITGDKENSSIRLTSESPAAGGELSKLATTRILTPADLAKLAELRTTASISSRLPSSHRKHHSTNQPLTNSQRHIDDALTEEHITGLSSLSAGKLTREEKAKLLQQHKDDHPEHKSKAARKKERKEVEGKSTTNKEKARKKNFLMTLGKAKSKGKRSLVEHKKILKMHTDRSKRGGKRGNR